MNSAAAVGREGNRLTIFSAVIADRFYTKIHFCKLLKYMLYHEKYDTLSSYFLSIRSS